MSSSVRELRTRFALWILPASPEIKPTRPPQLDGKYIFGDDEPQDVIGIYMQFENTIKLKEVYSICNQLPRHFLRTYTEPVLNIPKESRENDKQ